MGIRFRKSMKIAPGVRMNIGKKSVGVSIGGKGARYSVSSSGRTTTSASIPGTGLSYVSTGSTKKKRSTSAGPIRTGSSRGARVGGIVMLVLAGLALLIGLLSISVGGAVFLVMGAVFFLLGILILRKSKKRRPEE